MLKKFQQKSRESVLWATLMPCKCGYFVLGKYFPNKSLKGKAKRRNIIFYLVILLLFITSTKKLGTYQENIFKKFQLVARRKKMQELFILYLSLGIKYLFLLSLTKNYFYSFFPSIWSVNWSKIVDIYY